MTRTFPFILLGLALAATTATPSTARACSPDEPAGFSVAEEDHATDSTSPSAVEIGNVDVELYEDDGECFSEHYRVDIFVAASDDATAGSDMGYLVLEPGETAPTKLDVGSYVSGTYSGGRLTLSFDPEQTEATVVVHAVDHGGNVGPGSEVPIDLEAAADTGGCAVAPRGATSSGWLLAALAGLILGTRRRRA